MDPENGEVAPQFAKTPHIQQKVSDRIKSAPASQNVSESTKIRQPRSQTSTSIPSSPPKAMPNPTAKGSPNPSAALKPANIKSAFGTPKKQK